MKPGPPGLPQLGGKLHEEPTAKSRAGDRLVFLDHDTAGQLREHRKAQAKARMAAPPGGWHDNDVVFCQPDGRPWLPDHVSKKFKRLAAAAGVPVIKLHEDGRHTDSLMYDAEVHQDIVMGQVGHASKEISQRYNHPMIEAHLATVQSAPSAARLRGIRAAGQVSALVRKAGGRT